VTVLLFYVATFSAAQAAGVEIAVGGWQQNPSGNISYKPLDGQDDLDVVDDLDFGAEIRPIGRLKIDMPWFFPNLYLMASPMEFTGTGSTDFDFRFGDETFSANADVKTTLRLNQYDFTVYYGLPFLHKATLEVFNIDLGINARIVDFFAEIKGESASVPGQTIKEQESQTVVIPMAYVAVQVTPLKWLAVEAEGRGLAVGSNSLYSLIGRLRIQPYGPFFIAGGYRYDAIKIDQSDILVEASFGGPFAEIGLKF
jgi:outer membrane protein